MITTVKTFSKPSNNIIKRSTLFNHKYALHRNKTNFKLGTAPNRRVYSSLHVDSSREMGFPPPESFANIDLSRLTEDDFPAADAEQVQRIVSSKEQRSIPTNMSPYIAEFHSNTYAANAPNEDAHAAMASANGAMFGVFDGHGGRAACSFVHDELFPFVDRQLAVRHTMRTPKRFKTAFQHADNEFISSRWNTPSRSHEVYTGACAIAGYVTHDGYCYMANTGDCGGFIGTHTEDGEWVPRNSPNRHTADNPTEMKRIRQQHPHDTDAIMRGRLKGTLIPTRAFGSGALKHADINAGAPSPYPGDFTAPYLIPEPDVTRARIQTKRDGFMVLGSDGLWELLSPFTVARMVGDVLDRGDVETNLATLLITKALNNVSIDWDINTIVSVPDRMKRSFHDDITASVVVFKRPQSPLPSHLPPQEVPTTAQQAHKLGWRNH
eukprot:gb/GECH01003079.1/.p1 GENE.gb/GECH01003079.1/~~gb/GECH01003079.1/.p1  ORF type:complete len:437 (+),score=85.19 gb/GECH01003079.1/:1-1311(+)